jgi:hypothetical protein
VKNYYNTLAEEIFLANLEIISSMRRQIFYINLKKSLDTDDLKKSILDQCLQCFHLIISNELNQILKF